MTRSIGWSAPRGVAAGRGLPEGAAPAPGEGSLPLTVPRGECAVCRLPPETTPIPASATAGTWYSIARPAELAPGGTTAERGWRALRLEGPLPFTLTGILAAVLAPLAATRVPVFALSTYDTDYVLVKQGDLPAALGVLRAAGHTVDGTPA